MKTPREILLEQHQSAEAKLDALSPERLAALTRSSSDGCSIGALDQPVEPEARRHAGIRSVLEQFWRESLWPWRRVWAGLAAVWLFIFALNLAASSSSGPTGVEMANAKDPQVQAELREQKQFFAQLLGPSAVSDALPSKPPGPRSERLREIVIA